jgi:hypothetical protein
VEGALNILGVFIRTQYDTTGTSGDARGIDSFQAATEACVGEPAGDPLGDQRHGGRCVAAPASENYRLGVRAERNLGGCQPTALAFSSIL